MMGTRQRILLAIMAIVFLSLSSVSAEKISFSPESSQIQAGSSDEVAVVLAQAPSGLSGYVVLVELKNPGIGKIQNISYPSWVMLSNHTDLPSLSVTVTGVDLQDNVLPGARDILLFTINVSGDSAGQSGISAKTVTMQEEDGTPIQSDEAAGTIIVQGTASPARTTQTGSSGSGGGGGGSGMSVSAAAATQTLGSVTSTSPSTSGGDVTIQADTPVPTNSAPVGTFPTVSPDSGTGPGPGTAATPQGTGYFSLTGLLGGILVITGVILIILLFMKKRQG